MNNPAVFRLTAFVACVVALAGCDSRPDTRYFTKPNFTCTTDVLYCNETAAAGLDDVPRHGRGSAMVDVNNDGFQDLFLSDSNARGGETWGVSAFYINNGDGTFTREALGVDEADTIANWVGTFADYDNDGDQDLLLINGGYSGPAHIAFYENRLNEAEGQFVRRTDEAGFGVVNERMNTWWGVSWADYDNDGDVDVAVSGRQGRHYLFRNNGDKTFTEVAKEAGVDSPDVRWGRDGKNIVWIDYDNDNDQDLYFAGINGHDFFRNNGDGTFERATADVFAIPFPKNRTYKAGTPVVFAAAAIDFNQDGFEDLYLGRQAEHDQIMINDGNGKFSMAGTEIGLDALRTGPDEVDAPFENTMGLGVGDLQDDGYPDMVIGTGSPVRADEDVIYCNIDGERVERCTELFNGLADGRHWSRTHAVVFGDVNNDGTTDVWVNQGGHAGWDLDNGIASDEIGALYIRQPNKTANTATLTLEGTTTHRDAFGARVKVEGENTHYYFMRNSQAFQSQNSRALILALGNAEEALVTVTWPEGGESQMTVKAGERHHLKQ